jgi:hypothetical protein
MEILATLLACEITVNDDNEIVELTVGVSDDSWL